jgi:hypothetical protein
MHKKLYAGLLLVLSWMVMFPVMGQDSVAVKRVEMADRWRANGKIYVVIAVVVIILSGLILYVIRLDRKISRLEKSVK